MFDLADAVFARLDVPAPATRRRVGRRCRTGPGVRDISHGLVYLLPSVLLPVALALVGRHRSPVALIAASGFGWIWSAGSAWLAYRLLGRGLPASAGRVLRWAALVGTALGALTGLVIVAWHRRWHLAGRRRRRAPGLPDGLDDRADISAGDLAGR